MKTESDIQLTSDPAVVLQRVVSCETTISQLMSDIAAMRNMVLYYENRIIRKEIAIQEILSGKECREDIVGTPQILLPPERRAPVACKGQSVRSMIESILPELNGDVFWYSDIKEKCLAKYPEHEGKIRRGVHVACLELFKHGTLEKCPGGLRKRSS